MCDSLSFYGWKGWADYVSHSWEYIPFSGGPRICIGQQFALTQMLYLVARVLQTFKDIQPGNDEPMRHQVGSTLSMVGGCWIRLIPVEAEEV